MTEPDLNYFYGAMPVNTEDKTAYDVWDKLQPVSDPIRIFIGHDEIEEVAYHVLEHSIMQHTTAPVQITPIELAYLRPILPRPKDPKQSNEFSFSRFLVPWLCKYEGFAIYMDCDMMIRSDIARLWHQRDYRRAVQVAKHNYTPKNSVKYLGNEQYAYPFKNWSSLMLFNCSRCKALTPKAVNEAAGLDLHQFKWTDEYSIGDLGLDWNWLVGEYDYNSTAKLVHWTNGGPWLRGYENVDYSDEWYAMYGSLRYAKDASPRLIEAT